MNKVKKGNILQLFFDFDTVTRETFDNPAAFEYVYNQPTKFEQHTELGKLADAGRRVGVLDVKGRYQSYLETINGNRMIDYAVSAFQDPPGGLELQVGRWNADDTGIWGSGPNGELIEACSHPIMPIERFKNIDTGLEKIRLAFRRGPMWQQDIVVDKSDLASPQRIIDLADYGISVTSENARALIKFLQDAESMNYSMIPITKSTTRLGWVDKQTFLPYDSEIVYDGDVSFRNMFDATKAKGDYETWLEIAREARRKDTAVRIGMAASFASALLKKINSLSVFTHFWSSASSTGKTVILMLAASVWGDPEMGKLLQSFNTTEVASEYTCAFLNSIPLVMDELQLARDRYGNLMFNVYKISQGVGRARGRKTGGIEITPTWRLCCITSGETPLTTISDGAGAYARIIDVRIDDIIFDLEDGQRITKTIRNNYGHAGRVFVKKLLEIGDEELERRYGEMVKQINNSDKIQEKQRMAAAALLLADDIADEVIFQDDLGRLTFDELKPYLLTAEEISPGTRAYEFLVDWITANRNRFGEDAPNDFYGLIEDGWAYVVRSEFDRIMNQEGFSSRAVLNDWYLKGLIQTEESGGKTRYAKRRRIKDTRASFIVVSMPKDEEDYGH